MTISTYVALVVTLLPLSYAATDGPVYIDCHVNSDSQLICKCPLGYYVLRTGVVIYCEDINECVTERDTMKCHKCINTRGSFRCVCHDGLQLTADKRHCRDIDECKVNDGVHDSCAPHQCLNNIGGYTCDCKPGYKLSSCKTRCLPNCEPSCTRHGKCTVIEEKGICVCNTGYVGYTCSGRCLADPGYPKCICPLKDFNAPLTGDGFTRNGCQGYIATCPIRPDQSIKCEKCKKGYELKHGQNDYYCKDIDECVTEKDRIKCWRCTNLPGSFQCSCIAGFGISKDGYSCIDIDECLTSPCAPHTCLNMLGGYRCECDTGYILTADEKACVVTGGDRTSKKPTLYSHSTNTTSWTNGVIVSHLLFVQSRVPREQATNSQRGAI